MPITSSGAYRALAPQAFAETSPQFFDSYFNPRIGLPLETAFASYGQLYRSQIWVSAAVNKIADSIARLPIHVYDMADGEKTIDRDSPYAQLIAEPCVTMPRFSFIQRLAAEIEIFGESYLLKVREGRGDQVTSLIPMHPSMTIIHRNEYGELIYKFLGSPNEEFTERDVVPFKRYNPDGTMRGLSRLEALRSTLMTEDSARRAQQAWYQNRMRPSMIIRANRDLGEDGRARIAEAFSSRHGGSGNTGRVMVLENGEFEEPTIVQNTAEEMQYLESRQLAREEVAAGFDLNPICLQDFSHATFGNVVESLRSLYRDGLMHRIEMIESVLRTHVGGDFYGPKVAKFDLKQVLRGDPEKMAAANAQAIQSGYLKPSEAREQNDLPNAGPIANKLYAQQQIVPLGSPPAAPAAPAGAPHPALPAGGHPTLTPPAQAIPLTNGSVAKHVRDISALLGRGKTMPEAAEHVIQKTGDRDGVKAACEEMLGREL